MRSSRPPRLPEALLRRAAPPTVAGGTAVEDLAQEYRSMAARRGSPPRAWYWREALLLAGHFLFHRLRDPGARRTHATPGNPPMDRILQDLRFALRRLRRDPGFSAVAIVAVALGIGATVSIFSVLDAVLLRPLPYHEPDRLVGIWEWNRPRDRRTNVINPGNFRDWRERSESFEGMAALTMVQPLVLQREDGPEEARARLGSGGFFPLLGLDPFLGRWPVLTDETAEAPEVVLSHRYWRSGWGSDPGVVGRTLSINGLAATVVGVAPPTYVVFGEETDLWAAYPLEGDQTTTGRYLVAVARLKDGVTIQQARDEMDAIAAGLEEEHPEFNAGWGVTLQPLEEQILGEARTPLWLLMTAVGVLLLIACANVANLFLARAIQRQQEMAVRMSLGASGGRLGAQLLTESLLLAGAGAALGVALAWTATPLIAGALPDAFALPRMEDAGLDARVLVFAAGVTVLTGLLFGLAPAVHASLTAPASTLASEGRSSSRRSGRLRSGLVVLEVALSVVLLVGAGLLGRSFLGLVLVDPGIDPENLITARVSLTGPAYEGEEPDRVFFQRLAEGLRAVPGFEAAGGVSWLPLTGLASATSFHVEDQPVPPREDWPTTEVRHVMGDYFAAAGIQLLRGRVFDHRDGPDSEAVIVINRAMAERRWPGEDPIGKGIRLSWDGLEPFSVVGVVEDVRHHGLDVEEIRDMVYVAHNQRPSFGFTNLVVRSSLAPAEVARLLTDEVHALDPAIPLANVRAMSDVVAASVARPRMITSLMGVFAGLAALLTAFGLYSVLAFTVARRAREMGIRMAVGAESSDVLGLVLRQGMTLVALGLALGISVSLVGGSVLEGLLFRVDARDPLSVGGAVALLVVVATAACAVPAWRASRMAPAVALREE